MACVGARAIAVSGVQFRTGYEHRNWQPDGRRIRGSHGGAREGSKVTRFGGNIGWIRDYRKAVSGSSRFARAALQLHSIKRRSRCTAVFPGVSVLSKPTPALSKCLKLKCRVTSQAGRRRFESGLPLHLFNKLPRFRISPEALEWSAAFFALLQVTHSKWPRREECQPATLAFANGPNLLNLQPEKDDVNEGTNEGEIQLRLLPRGLDAVTPQPIPSADWGVAAELTKC